MTTEAIHPDSIEAKAHIIRDLGIRITEAEGPEEEEMIEEFARVLRESGKAPEIANYLYDTAPSYLETQPGHWYGVYILSGERGKGRLFTVQKILANPDQELIQEKLDKYPLHDHPMDETTLLVEGRIQSIMGIGSERIVVETQPLIPNRISKRIPHGAINPGPINAIGFCIRQKR